MSKSISKLKAKIPSMNTHRVIPANIYIILQEIRHEFQKIYDSRMKGVILFGSYARGDYSEGSDIDLILLLDKIDNLFCERERYLPIISQLSLKHDIVVSIIPMSIKEFESKRTPLILNAHREGVRI